MNKVKAILKTICDFSTPEHERFELIESYAELVTDTFDILHLLNFMHEERNAVLRHEISAQLLKINKRVPELVLPIINKIENFLIDTAINDESIVSRHEAIEALSSIGGEESLKFLLELSKTEVNKDILDTILISMPIIKRKIKDKKENYSQQEYCQ
jgi:hypothetical protein